MKTIDELGISNTPWEYDKESNEIICHLPNGLKYQIAVPYIHSDEEIDANASIIIAAPDMYSALFNQCKKCKDRGFNLCCDECEIGIALAKASGEDGLEMTDKDELKRLKSDRECDTEWLGKYKRIIIGLMTIAEIQADTCNNDIDEWSTVYHGLQTLANLIHEDIDGRKDEAK